MKHGWIFALVACAKQAEAPPPALARDAAGNRDATVIAVDATPPPPTKPHAVKLVVGEHASCAVMSDATVRCWGGNADGELGDGTPTDSATPVTPKLRGVKDLVLGDAHACALLDDGSVACWGKIGFGKPGPMREPAAVPGVTNVKHVFAVGGAGCATATDGKFACWGDVDVRGHVGTGTAHRAPTAVVGVDHVVELTPRAALRDDGDVVLATGERVGITGVIELASRGGVTCGRSATGVVRCFGAEQPCARPVKSTPKPTPSPRARKAKQPVLASVQVGALKLPAARRLAFDAGICVVTTAGTLACVDGCGVASQRLAKVDSVVGDCARLGDGTVTCAGKRGVGITDATQLAASGSRACALVEHAAVVCWDSGHAPSPIAF